MQLFKLIKHEISLMLPEAKIVFDNILVKDIQKSFPEFRNQRIKQVFYRMSRYPVSCSIEFNSIKLKFKEIILNDIFNDIFYADYIHLVIVRNSVLSKNSYIEITYVQFE